MAAGVTDGALIVDTGIDNSGFMRDARQFQSAVNNLRETVNRTGQQMSNSANGYIQAMARARNAARGLTGEQANLAREIAKTEAAIARLEQKQELQRRKFEASRTAAEENAAREFGEQHAGYAEWGRVPWESDMEAAEQMAEALSQRVREVSESFGEFEETAAFRNTSVEIEVLTERLNALKAALDELRAAEASASGDTDHMGTAAEESGEQAAGAATGFSTLGKVAGAAAVKFLQLAGKALNAGASIARIAGGAAVSYLKNLAASARNAAIQLAKLSGRAISGGFKTLGRTLAAAGKWMLGIKSASAQANGGFKRGLMTILKYGLGIRSMYFLFRKLRQAISEGFTELAKHDARTKASLESLQRALNGLKGSLATAFSPILTAVAPALTKLINMLASAINAIGAFIAALTGQRTYQKAVGGLNATGSAAGGAADNVKELNRQLAKFDDLNILSDKSNDSGGGGGGGGGGSGFTYETEQISGGILDFVDKLKELWANADYEGIGREIAGAINKAFDTAKDLISWDNLGEKITESVDAITGIFNGLIDGLDWELIGQTFGEGINTIVNTANQLLTKIDWENLGKKLSEGLNGLVSTVNWSNLGAMFANKLNALIDTIKGAVSSFNWGDAGTAFAKAVAGLLTTVKWADLGGDFATLINGTVEALKSAITAFNWGEAGKTFGTAVSSLTTKVDWATLGGNLAQLLNSAVDALRSALSAFNWGEAGKTFAASINKILTTVKWAELGSGLAQLLNSALDALHSALAEFKWGEAGKAFGEAVSSLLSSVKWAQLGGDLATLLNGAVGALRSALEAFNWEDAGRTFSNTINSLISKVDWTELGKTLSASLKSALDWLVAALSQFNFGAAGQAFADAINGFFSDPAIWEKAGEAVSTAIKGLFTWSTNFLNKLNTEQIASDLQKMLGKVDWPGIGEAIFKFLIAAIKAAGNLWWDLLTDFPDPDKLKEKWKKEVLGDDTEVDLVFGLNPIFEDDNEAIQRINEAIAAALEDGNFVFPVGLDVPPETVLAASMEFVKLWNNIHPKAPLTVDAETGEISPLIQDLIDDGIDANASVKLVRDGWTTLTEFVGVILPRAFKLARDGWTSIAAFVGNIGMKKFSLGRDGWTSISDFVGTLVKVFVTLANKDKKEYTPAKIFGTALRVTATLANADKKKYTPAKIFGTSITVTAKLVKKPGNKLTYTATKQGGNKMVVQREGGIITPGGLARYLSGVPHYAGGTTRAHGTVFVAGEAGPEVMGHINGRTEILNRSQIAQSIYGAVVAGMGQAVNALGAYLANQMAACTNAITGTIGALSASAGFRFRAPDMASGGVLPYEVAAQVARSSADIQSTLDANNEDLIQTIISVSAQVVAAVQSLQSGRPEEAQAVNGGMNLRQVVFGLNRQTQMFGASPLKGV